MSEALVCCLRGIDGMNKKEVSEIKRTMTPQRSCFSRICGCYVDGEKAKLCTFRDAFLSIPEEEMYKYFDIFKKNLSGTLGKNLLNMEFPLEQEMEDGTQAALLKLRDSELKDDEILTEFYDRVIETWYHPENYLILLVYGSYDIPMKTSDGIVNEDASDYVYNFVMCSLCPVELSKGGLCYNAEKNTITERVRDWLVGMPEQGFLFPAFNDRNTDIHSLLYYTKKPEEISAEITQMLLGCEQPVTAGEQKDSFQSIIEDTLGEDCSYDVVRNIHENLNDLIEENKDNPDPVELDKSDVKRLLSASGASADDLEGFEERFDEQLGEHTSVMAKNISDTRKFEVKTADVTVKVNPKRPDLVETRYIDGRPCLVIELNEGVEVNGIRVHTGPEENKEAADSEDGEDR